MNTMSVESMRISLPGDIVHEIKCKSEKQKNVIGPGLQLCGKQVKNVTAGMLYRKNPNMYFVDNLQKRYIPVRGESVIGVIVQKAGDFYKVDIGAAEPASLSYLAFENTTKKNRPDVNIGDAIFAKLLAANKDVEAELVCVDSHGKKGKLGILDGGFVFDCSINLVRKILNKNCPLLDLLSKEIPFEIAAGLNGKIWINGRNTREIVAVGNAILASEFVEYDKMTKICQSVANSSNNFF